MKKQLPGFFAGILAAVLALTLVTPALADSIEAAFNSVNISVDDAAVAAVGDNYTLDNGKVVPYSIVYEETTYLPVRKITELTGLTIQWLGDTSTVAITSAELPIVEGGDTVPLSSYQYIYAKNQELEAANKALEEEVARLKLLYLYMAGGES